MSRVSDPTRDGTNMHRGQFGTREEKEHKEGKRRQEKGGLPMLAVLPYTVLRVCECLELCLSLRVVSSRQFHRSAKDQ